MKKTKKTTKKKKTASIIHHRAKKGRDVITILDGSEKKEAKTPE